jgi:hypothetical protein
MRFRVEARGTLVIGNGPPQPFKIDIVNESIPDAFECYHREVQALIDAHKFCDAAYTLAVMSVFSCEPLPDKDDLELPIYADGSLDRSQNTPVPRKRRRK